MLTILQQKLLILIVYAKYLICRNIELIFPFQFKISIISTDFSLYIFLTQPFLNETALYLLYLI